MTVSISGSCLASLLFKLKNVPGDADGFILGKVYSLQVKNITDSQSTGLREERKLCLHSFINFKTNRSFYTRSGHPADSTKLHHMLGEKYNDVIGWFSYRKNSAHRISMMERAVHTRLAGCFDHLQNQDFLLGLITEKLVDTSTVHSTEYSFQYWDGRKFQVIESEMLTLPSSLSYQHLPTRLLPPHLTHYNTLLKEQSVKFISSGGDDVMQCISMEGLCTAMLQKLKPLEDELVTTSKKIIKERNEVLLLREAVGVATREKEEKACPPSSVPLNEVPPSGVPLNEVPFSGVPLSEVYSMVPPSDAILIDIDDDLTKSHDPLSCDASHDPLSCDASHDPSNTFLTPSLDLLCSDVAEGVLIPSAQHSNISKIQDTSSLQYLSQELF